jgi:hypothetical protein
MDWSSPRISFWTTNTTVARQARRTTARGRACCRPSPRAALCAASLVAPSPERSPTAVSWRARPRDLSASAILPAATAEVAHATRAGCHRLAAAQRLSRTRRSDPDGISEVGRRVSPERLPTVVSEAGFRDGSGGFFAEQQLRCEESACWKRACGRSSCFVGGRRQRR